MLNLECPKMDQRKAQYLLPGDYVMIADTLALVLANNWPYLAVTRFVNGRFQPREVHRIVQDLAYHVPCSEFVRGMGALVFDPELGNPAEFVALVDDDERRCAI